MKIPSSAPEHTASEHKSLPKTAESKAEMLAKEAAVKEEKRKKLADLQVELESKQTELNDLTATVEGERAEYAKVGEEKKEVVRQELVKLQNEVKVLVEELKEESEVAKILREHGGLESNIPLNHAYWRMR